MVKAKIFIGFYLDRLYWLIEMSIVWDDAVKIIKKQTN